MMDKVTMDALNEVRNRIHAAAGAHNTPTVVNMARNATMFLDTAYMWMSTMDQVIQDMDSRAADAPVPGVTQGDFSPKG